MVVDDEPIVREVINRLMTRAGHEVVEASNGSEALEIVGHESIDIILMDVSMPVMDGFETLRRLRANPLTEDLPVIMLTTVDAAIGEKDALDLGVEHYISKPLESGVLESTVKVILRNIQTVNTPIRIGERLLDEKLGGGIPLGSLALIEGTSAAGKSVICQHFMSRALKDGHSVACFTSENDVKSLLSQMASIGLDVSGYLRSNKFLIYPIEEPPPDADNGILLVELAQKIEGVPRQCKVVCVDAITNFASASPDHAIVGFFSACKRLCVDGRVIILVAHSFAFDERMLVRLRALCSAHLNLRVENAGSKQARVLEVSKIQNAEGTTGNLVFFNVEPQIGMRLLPFSKAHA
jgi:flagellar protein FlaH